MKLKLIEAGGFTGRRKTAEKELADLPQPLQTHVETLFSKTGPQPAQARAQSASRDKEQYFIEYNGKTLPFQSLQENKALHDLVEQMKEDLHFDTGKP